MKTGEVGKRSRTREGGKEKDTEDIPRPSLLFQPSFPFLEILTVSSAAEIRISEIVAVDGVEEKDGSSIYIALTNQASGRFK